MPQTRQQAEAEQPLPQQEPPMDTLQLIKFLEDRRREDEDRRRQDEDRRRQDEDRRRAEEAERRRVEDAQRREEFRELLTALTGQQLSSTQPPERDTPPRPAQPTKAVIHPPPPLLSDVNFQAFREWRRKWTDYATMIDLSTLSPPKQHIQLRMCLSSDVLHTLEYRLQVPCDNTKPVTEVLDALEAHIKSKTNEAIRRRDLFSCKQAAGETFDDFYVRVKSLAEAVDICKSGDNGCEETQLKQVLLMGVRDTELVQELIGTIPTHSLDDVVKQCYAFEAARNTASAIASPSPAVRATSQYKRDKKLKQRKARSPTPTKEACHSSNKSHVKGKCPAADSMCHNCGKRGHWARTSRCPAKNASCGKCGITGHYDQHCRKSKASGSEKTKERREQGSTESNNRSSVRRVHSTSRAPPMPPPTISVTVTHHKGSGVLSMLPDTGADVTVIGPEHLRSLGLSISDLQPSPTDPKYTADGSPMAPALGSLQVEISVKQKTTTVWMDVHEGTPNPLLSCHACRELALIPERFPQPIAKVTHANVCTSNGAQSTLPLPFTNVTSPAEARAYFVKEYSDVLVSKADLHGSQLRPMTGPPMRIHLREDATPFAIHTPRQIPLAFRETVKTELESMVARGIITPTGDEPSPWCHPLVAVAKPSGGVRITTDLSKLNSQVSRPAHPSPTPFAAVRSIDPKARYFTTIDALCGYWQLELAEQDQPLTTFITPYGRYKYLRGPMGFAATGDAFCLRGDMALQGVPNCVKVVDDVLVYGEDYLQHLHHVNTVLARCRASGITLNAEKFILAAPAVKLCGFVLSANGIDADPEKVRAITDFPTPANITDLRSFMGLVNQLTEFTPEISAAAQPLRPLMSPRRAFVWTVDHEEAFQRVKAALSTPPQLAMFDPQLPTTLQTDASRLNGIGYALLQDHGGGKFRLIQCGSRFLTDAETRYATIELEMLAAVWAMQKCSFYLKGLHHFEHVTDHRPLIPILNNYTLDAVENPRLQRLKEKLSPYIFTARWRAGKTLCIADALSRHPVSHPSSDDDMLSDISVKAAVTLRAIQTLAEPNTQATTDDRRMEELQQAARDDEAYTRLLDCVRNGFPSHRYDLHPSLLPYWKLRDELYCDGDLVLYGPRVVVPATLRRSVLARLHDSHRGAEATKRRAQQTVFWPGINSDITNVVRACDACQTMLPSQQKEPYLNDDRPTRPFESVSADHFTVAGKAFLIIADRLSGWPAVAPCGRDTTTAATIRQFRCYFRDVGVPVRLRTDGGPQFTSRDFTEFLARWGVKHVVTSPYHPQSNGHAEAAVKSIKHLITKVAPSGNIDCEPFDRGLLEIRNTPNHTGRSPAQILYGRPLRTCVPAHPESFKQEWQAKSEECDRRAAQRAEDTTSRYNQHARPLPALQISQQVRIQDHTSKRWDKVGKVMGRGRSRQYQILLPSGRILWRNRRHLRPAVIAAEDLTPGVEDHPEAPTPRRSRRLNKDEAIPADEGDVAQDRTMS
ncbi:uncharacterized protein LOC126994436 [Eriocheir sinensis]|uniref:uncharacterized protein LOC126994436 n=1 Tax=Eriocheir sinensis TaxID=95602 RepID=UPI0021CA376C|nr:uncharacterized protein LOC126994436 [Eriocheir sinensis]